ncbi:MAG: IS1380 family transposase [Thermoguttaceae bacterium]
MSLQSVFQVCFGFFDSKPVVVEPQDGQFTTDAGLLPFRQFDEKLGFTQQFATALNDPRDPAATTHSFTEMVRVRIFGILADYADQNDHDLLRTDPLFKLLAGRSPDDGPLASQPTLSRFENAIDIPSLWRLRDVFIDQFIASFTETPLRLTFDVDTFDDPTHGQQQLTFFHGFYDQYQYLPRVITCAQNDMVVMLSLLFGIASPFLGFDRDLEYLVNRLRVVWPDVQIALRADSGFASPEVYDACERLRLIYTIGLGMNAVLKRRSEAILVQVVAEYERSKELQRQFTAFGYQAESWPHERFVVVKAEANPQGTNRRAVVTNRPGAQVIPSATYDEYTERGESENRNKELKNGLQADRLSDHRYLANFFRLYLHSAAANLLARMRPVIADPPPPPPTVDDRPPEALSGKQRRDYFNLRRQRDPLGEGHPCTWRTRLIKVAAEITVSARRIVVHLAGSWPYLDHYQHVAQRVLAFCQTPVASTG